MIACQNNISFHIVQASLAECYSRPNHIITQISIQIAGLAFGGTGLCSYPVRGVDGSCAEHLTAESYTVIICQQSYLLLLVFHHPLTLIPGLKLSFSANPSHRSFSFSSSGFTTWIPQTVYCTSEHIRLYFLVFLFYTFSCRFRAVD